MNIIYKTKLKFWYNIKKGYIKFFKSKGLEEYRSFKQDLFLVRINHKELPFDLIEQKDINKTLIQYVNQKLFDNYFFYVFLFFFNKKKKIIFPIPKEFNNVLKKYNYEVNFFLSNILWKVFTILQMLNGFKEIIVLLFSAIKFRNSKKIHQNYSIYPNFNPEKLNLGLTKESNSKLYNVVRWCDDYFSNSYSVFFSKKK